jgi:hypothetical protein
VVELTLHSCQRRISLWRTPHNWSRAGWSEEISRVAIAAAQQAVSVFDPSGVVQLGAFVYMKVMASCRTRQRQERAYGLRFLPLPPASTPDEEGPAAASEGPDWAAIRELLPILSERQRAVLIFIFWEGLTESESAARLKVSQPAVARHKRAGLESLRLLLG